MAHDVEREEVKKLFTRTFGENVAKIVDKMTDAQVVVIYMRLRLQGKLNRRNKP